MKKFPTTSEGISLAAKTVVAEIEKNKEKYTISSKGFVSAIFLAGAPWSWKTEFILSILKDSNYFFIDIDSYRDFFVWYVGNNSQDFQKSISWVVDKVMKYCFQNDICFILDGTFKSITHVQRNIDNCKRKKRNIKIYFMFQNPYVSYYYTFLRKLKDERNIPVEGFIECFYESIKNIFIIKEKYKYIQLSICEKNNFLDKIITEKDYTIREDMDDIRKFCKLYGIAYNNSVFTYRDRLEAGIKSFDNLLNLYKPFVKLHRLFLDFKKKKWQKKKKDS